MKAIIAGDDISEYADLNIPFGIYTNSSDYQMGAVIMQKLNYVAYCSIYLFPSRKNYNTMEKELLATRICMEECRGILYGAVISISTYHNNIIFLPIQAQRVDEESLSEEE